ncbi:MAG: hypothetical protein U1F98_01795 [Verrucomicrobiota bacterium]
MIRLFTIGYDSGSVQRQEELSECLRRNLDNRFLGQVVLWQYNGVAPSPHPKLSVFSRDRQPTFEDLFALANSLCAEGDVAIVANSDIWFDETAVLTERILPMQCFALLRTEETGQLSATREGKLRKDSQDAWVFRAPIRPAGAHFHLGRSGCDNALAYLLTRRGYEVRNPAKSIRIHHRHASRVRPFTARKYRVPPPWMHVEPTDIDHAGERTLVPVNGLKWWWRIQWRRIAGQPGAAQVAAIVKSRRDGRWGKPGTAI